MPVFDPKDQQNSIESKIVVSLERLSEAFRVLLWDQSKATSLSPIQLQILVFVLYHSQDKCKIGYLAREFNMTKPTISDSVKVLIKKGLLKKEADEQDSRSFSLSLTPEGHATAVQAATFAAPVKEAISRLTEPEKSKLLTSLLGTIYHLNRSGIIGLQRMCFTCIHYRAEGGQHYCKLLQMPLSPEALRIDCPEHEGVSS